MPAELAAQLDFNPLSFLLYIKPAYTNQKKLFHLKKDTNTIKIRKSSKNEIILVKIKTSNLHS
jgi:hypothetical protein